MTERVRLWLDDERDPREWLPHIRWWRGRPLEELDEWVWVKTAPEAIGLLQTAEVVEASLDHDLGEARQVGDGYEPLVWIEGRCFSDGDYAPPMLHTHSSNIGGRERLERGIEAINRRFGDRRQAST